MKHPALKSELALVIAFLVIISSVPIAQTALELARGERVQFTDVARDPINARNLRQYEKTLEDKSWFQQKLRPLVQQLYYTLFRETGSKAMLGRDGWLFYRPDVRYVLEPNLVEIDKSDSAWVRPDHGLTQRDYVVKTIVNFRDQLQARGIQLLVVPIPGKPSIYPDKVTHRVNGQSCTNVLSPTRDLLTALQAQDVATVDLYSLFQAQRQHDTTNAASSDLYLAQDTHWTPLGAQLAAQQVARQILQLGWISVGTNVFQTRHAQVQRTGDILEMMQIPGANHQYPPQTVDCTQVLDLIAGGMVPSASDRPGTYKYPTHPSPILVLGDSFCRIYQLAEPKSLGEVIAAASDDKTKKEEVTTRKLLPGSAGFTAHLALAVKNPVDYIVSDGGASTDVRKRLNMNPEILESKKVVVWEFVERDVRLGRDGWEEVDLPQKLGN